MRAYYHRKRAEVVSALGGKCIICGDTDIKALRIDHKNGYNGYVSSKGSRGGFTNLWDAIKLIRSGKINELQLLCWRCDR